MDTNMKTIASTGKCPYCGKKIPGYKATKISYGSPVRVCPKCDHEYYDRRFFEPVISGPVKSEFSKKRCLNMMFASVFFFAAAFAINWLEIRQTGEYYVVLALMQPIAIITFIMAIVDLIRISVGSKQKKFDFEMSQSEERLRNPEYAEFLKSKGLEVPEKYLPMRDSVSDGNL